MSKSHSHFKLRRRDLLQGGASLAAAAAVSRGLVSTATAAAANTLVIAAPATPQSLDCNFDVSLGTFEAIAVLYDNLLEFKKIPRALRQSA
jgi:peptide/nickel transport system substrate-binding protein